MHWHKWGKWSDPQPITVDPRLDKTTWMQQRVCLRCNLHEWETTLGWWEQ